MQQTPPSIHSIWQKIYLSIVCLATSGPTEKVQALHRSLNMADAAIGKRVLWSIVRFLLRQIYTWGYILQVRDVNYG